MEIVIRLLLFLKKILAANDRMFSFLIFLQQL